MEESERWLNDKNVIFEDFKLVYSYNIVNVAIVCWLLQSILPISA